MKSVKLQFPTDKVTYLVDSAENYSIHLEYKILL
jgi:hypothetical protein